MTDDSDERLALVLASALDGLKQQEASLDNLRARSGTLLASAALSASFLGAATFGESSLSDAATAAVVVALVGLVGVLAVVVVIDQPRKWGWYVNPRKMLKNYVEPHARRPATVDQMREDLALHLDDAHTKNDERLDCLWNVLRVGYLALVVEVVAWMVALALR